MSAEQNVWKYLTKIDPFTLNLANEIAWDLAPHLGPDTPYYVDPVELEVFLLHYECSGRPWNHRAIAGAIVRRFGLENR